MEKKLCYIYEIMDHRGYFYVGKRFESSEKTKNYYGSGSKLLNALRKYKKENFIKTVLEENYFTAKELCDLEKYYIKLYRETKNAYYNITDGGEGGDTFTNRSEQSKQITRQKISNLHKGKSRHLGNKFRLNKFHSEESKKKISQSKKQNYIDDPTLKFKTSHPGIGKDRIWWTNGTVKKHCKECPVGFYPVSKKVKCIETGEIFNNAKTAGPNVLKVCKGERKTANGLHYEFC